MQEKYVETNDIVKLKPIMGIKPGVYLTVLYSIALIIIFFFIFIYHGLVNYGTVLIVNTDPLGAAVRVNGTYLGVSGTKIPMPNYIKPNETVTIEVVLPGFLPSGGTCQIPGGVFGTRFFPRKFRLFYRLASNNDDPAGVLVQAASEYAAWTFGGEPTAAWQVPLVLSEGAYRTGSAARTLSVQKHILADRPPEIETDEILKAAARFAVTRAALRDLARAKTLLDNWGQSPSPAAITNSLSDILVFLSENSGTAKWLADLLPPQSAAVVRSSEWYKKNEINEQIQETSTSTTGQISVSGLIFKSAGRYMISETPVPKTLFEAFLAENPQWTEHYIDYFENEPARHPAQIYNSETVTGVSWYAAEAFCKWLTQRLPASMSNMEVRLPAQTEIEFAGNSGIIAQEQIGWEWCADPFAPLDFVAGIDAIQAIGSPERTLYGRQTAGASLPPDSRSPIVSFRLVIAEQE